MQTYDTIVIGAGVAGACSAYFLSQKGQKVLVIDRKGIASGGSGAAGAFVSPKIGKGSPLQQLTNEAFLFARDFYLEHFPESYHQTGVVRIPKDAEDAQKFSDYAPYNENRYETLSVETQHEKHIHVSYESFFFPEAGVCDAEPFCHAALDGIDVVIETVATLHYEEGLWQVGDYRAKQIVLATGYQHQLADLAYMGIKGTWGTRGDFKSELPLEVSMHRSMSVSANINGVIKLGATHEKSVKTPVSPCEETQALGLKEKAKSMIESDDLELIRSYCGMRAGSKDYFPLVGKVIDVSYMLESYPKILVGAKPPLQYVENLYLCNGLGGRGFVFGPMMGKALADLIVDGTAVDPRINPDRLFLKWCRHKDRK